MSDNLKREFALLRQKKDEADRQDQKFQEDQLRRLAPIKQEHEEVIKTLEGKLASLAKMEPKLLNTEKTINYLPAYRSYRYPVFFGYRSEVGGLTFEYNLYLYCEVHPRPTTLADIQAPNTSFRSARPVLKPEVRAYANVAQAGLLSKPYIVIGSLGELVFDPKIALQNPNAKQQLYEEQVTCLSKVKELLDDRALALVAFQLIERL